MRCAFSRITPAWRLGDPRLLGAPAHLSDLAEAARRAIAESSLASMEGDLRPKHGKLAAIAAATPVLAYAAPELSERFPHSFCDGDAVYFSQAALLGASDLTMASLLVHLERIASAPCSEPGASELVASISEQSSAYARLRRSLPYPDAFWTLDESIPASGLGSLALRRMSGWSANQFAQLIHGKCGFDAAAGARPPSGAEVARALGSLGMIAAAPPPDRLREPEFLIAALAEREARLIEQAAEAPPCGPAGEDPPKPRSRGCRL